MNVTNLKAYCISSCHSAYDAYKHQIFNSPFKGVSFNYITACLEQLVIDVNCGVTKSIFKECTPTEAQCLIIHNYIEEYLSITIEKAFSFGMKRISE